MERDRKTKDGGPIMRTLIFDLECDNLYPDTTTIWCMGYKQNGVNNPDLSRDKGEILALLNSADTLVGHNIIGYDLPVLEKLWGWKPRADQVIRDTLVYSRLLYTDLASKDKVTKEYNIGKLVGSHSLEAWGTRMKFPKGNPPVKWDVWDDLMVEYCLQDVKLTSCLYDHLLQQATERCSVESVQLEHHFATIIQRQMNYGVSFDSNKARELYIKLHRDKEAFEQKLRSIHGGWYKSIGEFTPKKSNAKRGYRAGVGFTKIKWVLFNPCSNDHIIHVLKRKYNWRPTKFTPGGKPCVDALVLMGLSKYPDAKDFYELKIIQKLLGYLGDGDESWMKNEREGRLHGYVNPNGAVTGRCTHSKPNLGNVPSPRAKYGNECRALFKTTYGHYRLLGFDASGLELRCLGGYLAYLDGGEYQKTVVHGKKEEGTDIHSLQAEILGTDRDTEKTWFYAYIYGAGDGKLGSILGKGKHTGEQSRRMMESRIFGLGKLVERVHKKASKYGYLVGLDGRRLKVRSAHSALNTLLQGAGAVLMKRALIILDESIQNLGFTPGKDYEFVLNVHDEWQVECMGDNENISIKLATLIGDLSKIAIKRAGEYYDFKCPLDGEYSIGTNWSETH